MATNPLVLYPGQVDVSDPTGYPYGKPQNEVVFGDGSGTPWEAGFVADVFGLLQSLLSFAGTTPSNTPDKVGASQYLDALAFLRNSLAVQAVTLSSDVSNWAPTGGDVAMLWAMSVSGNFRIKGIAAPAKPQIKILRNRDAVNKATIVNNDAGQTAGNKIKTPTGADYIIPPLGIAILVYDPTLAFWYVVDRDIRALDFAWTGAHSFVGITASGGVTAAGDVKSTAGYVTALLGLISSADVQAGASGEFKYSSGRQRTKYLQLTRLRPALDGTFGAAPQWALSGTGASIVTDSVGDSDNDTVRGWTRNTDASAPLMIPLELPSGSTIKRVRVGVYKTDASTATLRVFNSVIDTVTSRDLYPTTTLIAKNAVSLSGWRILDTGTISAGGDVDNTTQEAWAELVMLKTGDRVTWVEVTFADNYVRNF